MPPKPCTQMNRRLRLGLFLLLLLGSCDWGSSRLQPDKTDQRTPLIGMSPAADRLARHRLENGMAVLVLPPPTSSRSAAANSQIVHGCLRVETGWHADPEEWPGLAQLTANVVLAGLPAQQAAPSMSGTGGHAIHHFQADVQAQWTDFYFRTSAQTLRAALGYLYQGIAETEFAPEQMDRAMQRMRQTEKPSNTGLLEDARRAYPGYELASDHSLQAPSMAIPASAVRRFYAEQYGSRNAILALSHQNANSNWMDSVASTLGGWRPQAASRAEGTGFERDSNTIVIVAPGQQNDWMALASGLRWDHPDMPALLVAGRLLSNANWQLEWQGGYRHAGRFVAQGQSSSNAMSERLEAFMHHLGSADVALQSCTDEQLQAAVRSATLEVVRSSPAIKDRLERALDLEYFGYPRNFDELLEWSLSRLSKKEVIAATRRHLRTSQLRFFLRGESDQVRSQLVLLQFLDAPSAEESVLLTEPQAEQPSQATIGAEETAERAASVDTGQGWSARILQAHGGVAAWQGAALFATQLRRQGYNGRAPSEAQVILENPNRLRYQAFKGSNQKLMNSSVVVVNDEGGWQKNGDRVRTLMASERHSWNEFAMALLPTLLMELARGNLLARDLAAGTAGVELTSSSGISFELHCLGNGQIERLRCPNLMVQYLGFQTVNGLKLPARLSVTTRSENLEYPAPTKGKADSETWQLFQWQVNPPRQPNWFDRPQGGNAFQ